MNHETEDPLSQAVNLRSGLPRSADLLMGFRTAQHEGQADPILTLGHELAVNHQKQWDAEDSCRDPAATVSEVGTAKRLIDELNTSRVALVERVDEVVESRVAPASGLPLHTETIGSVVDRLAIAWVRTNSFTSRTDRRDRARSAIRQMNELATAYDDLVRDLVNGHRRLPAWRTLKSYGSTS
jgi:hypothetical protein